MTEVVKPKLDLNILTDVAELDKLALEAAWNKLPEDTIAYDGSNVPTFVAWRNENTAVFQVRPSREISIKDPNTRELISNPIAKFKYNNIKYQIRQF